MSQEEQQVSCDGLVFFDRVSEEEAIAVVAVTIPKDDETEEIKDIEVESSKEKKKK